MKAFIVTLALVTIPMIFLAPQAEAKRKVSIYAGRMGDTRMNIIDKCGCTKYIDREYIVYINPHFRKAKNKRTATMLVTYYFHKKRVIAIRYSHYTAKLSRSKWSQTFKDVGRYYTKVFQKNKPPIFDSISKDGVKHNKENYDKLIQDRKLIVMAYWERKGELINLLSYMRRKGKNQPDISLWIFKKKDFPWLKNYLQQLSDGTET